MRAPFPIVPYLTAIAIGYSNRTLIADLVLPRVPVGRQEFKYFAYGKADSFTVPKTLVGRKSRPNRVEFGATELAAFTTDHALDAEIPKVDIDNATQNPALQDPQARHAQVITDLILLDREVRVASKVFDPASYATDCKETLAGGAQFSDFTNSDPIATVQAALDGMLMRPNTMVVGRAAFSTLVRHPKIVKAFNGTAGDSGIVTRQFIAQLFELDDVLVGEGFINTAKPGQPANFQRVWGKNMALIYKNANADTQNGTTYGYTAEFGTRIAGAWEDPDIGMRGGVRVRVGESVTEIVAAPDLGFLIQNVVA